VLAFLAWLIHRDANQRTPLFYFQSSAPLTRSAFVVRLKDALSTAGIDPARFAGHSFQVGATTTDARKGLND